MSIAYAVAQYLKTTTNPIKHEKWQSVLTNMASGVVNVGSRKPHKDFPVWATPEVIWGGYTSGRMLAGGDLAQHEQDLANELLTSTTTPTDPAIASAEQRATVQSFLAHTEDGIRVLCYRLQSKLYRIDVPEEGCLMVYAWLCERGFIDEAQKLLESVESFFARLRFHPAPVDRAQDLSRVSLISTQQLQKDIATRTFSSMHGAEPKTCDVGKTNLLFRDRYVKLWLMTVNDPSNPPTGIFVGDDFQVDRSSALPCQVYPADWDAHAKELLEFYETHQGTMSRTTFYTTAADVVRRAVHDRRSLTGLEVSRIRCRLASVNVKHGLPGDDRYTQWMLSSLAAHEEAAQTPTLSDIYKELGSLIGQRPCRDSLSPRDVDEIVDQMTSKFPGCKRLKLVHRRLSLAMEMTCDELFDSQLVRSPETLAGALTTFTSIALAGQVQDDSARYLYQQLHLAFARRRSLLLLNYASQVKIDELPWVAALGSALAASGLKSDNTSDLQTFIRRTIGLSLRRFGERPIRNEFVRLLRTLFKSTGTECVLLEELAADIFMGGFVPKFGQAHIAAQQLLAGTCYDRYYNISEMPPSSNDSTPHGDGFAMLCRKRATGDAATQWNRYSVAANGMVIEQAQILTTHNMSSLMQVYDLVADLSEMQVPAIIRRGVAAILKKLWLIHRLQTPGYNQSGTVGPLVRDIGGLWRQMVFWFAVLEKYDSIGSYCAMVDELESIVFENGADRCPVQDYQAHFRNLLLVLRNSGGRAFHPVVLGWSVRVRV